MQKEEAIDNLKSAKEILENLGIPFWLAFGSALGAYRDHDFCEGDEWDIDFATYIEQYAHIERIKEAFLSAGFTIRLHGEHPTGVCPEISFTRGGNHVDLFFFTPFEGKIAFTFYSKPPVIRLIADYFRQFDTVEWFGMTFNVPHPIEEYLRENYGNWKVKIPTRDWHWATDNKCSIILSK